MQTIRGGGVSGGIFKFVDLKTLPERMKNEETLVLEYRMKDGDWHRLRFVEKRETKTVY